MTRSGRGRIVAGLVMIGWLLGMASAAWAQVPSESDVYVDRGILAYDNKQYSDALQAFQEALRLTPENVTALYYTGLTYMALEQYGPAQAALEQAQKLAPTDLDVAFQLGVADFLLQQYDKAEPLFRQVYAGEPKRQNVGYYLGFIEYRKQNYREALKLFQANVPSDENFAQLTRFYAGLSLSALGLARQARAEIEEALRLQPASPLITPAERFRDVLGPAAEAERTFHVDVKTGFFYDDNVAVIPNRSGDPVATAARDTAHRSVGELGYVRFQYTPLRTPDWEASIGSSILQTLNNDVNRFNTLNPSADATLAYKTSIRNMPTVGGLTLSYDYYMLDDRNYLNRYTVAPFVSLIWDAMNLTQAQLRLQPKDFMNQKNLITTADNRDALNYMAGLVHFLRFQADRHYLKFGYQYDWEQAKGSNWSYAGNRFLVGGQYTLFATGQAGPAGKWWQNIRFRYDLDTHIRGYSHLHNYLPVTSPETIHRADWELTHQFSLSKDLPWDLTVSVEYLRDENISNLKVYDYTRNVISFNVSWRY